MQLSVFMRCGWETKTKKYIYGLCRFVKSGGNGNGRTTVKWEILFAVLDTLKVSQRVSREVSYTFSENQLLASLQGHMFESDSGVGLKCFETKVRHIQSHNRGLSKEKEKKKRKEIALASHQELISAPLVNISIRTFFHSKTEKSPNDTYCHPLLSWGSVHFAQAYPEPHYTALCQPSKNSKPT